MRPVEGLAEPWMVREQCPQAPKPYTAQPRPLLRSEVMAAPQTWAEFVAERAARRAAPTDEGS